MRKLVQLHQERSKVNKRSEFIIRNRRIDFQEAIRYFARKGKSIEDLDPARAPQVAAAVRCLTPAQPSLENPTELETAERALYSAKVFAQGYYNSQFRYRETDAFWHLMNEFGNGSCLVENLFSRGAFQEGGQALIAVTAYLEDLVRLFSVSEDVAHMMLQQFESLAKTFFLDQNHPMITIISSVTDRRTPFSTLTSKIVLVIIDQLSTAVDWTDWDCLVLRCDYLQIFVHDVSTKAKGFCDLLELVESSRSDSLSGLISWLRRELGIACVELGDYTQAAEVAAAMTRQILEHPCVWKNDVSWDVLLELAQLQGRLGNYQAALQHVSEVVKLTKSSRNFSAFDLARNLVRQEYYATKLGDLTTAAAAREQRIEIIRQENGGVVELENGNALSDIVT